jgi:hypothetical protein
LKEKDVRIFDVLPHTWINLINLATAEIKASYFMIFWEESEVISAEIIQICAMNANSVQVWKSRESFPGNEGDMRCAEN